jgi:hypothetical protein
LLGLLFGCAVYAKEYFLLPGNARRKFRATFPEPGNLPQLWGGLFHYREIENQSGADFPEVGKVSRKFPQHFPTCGKVPRNFPTDFPGSGMSYKKTGNYITVAHLMLQCLRRFKK